MPPLPRSDLYIGIDPGKKGGLVSIYYDVSVDGIRPEVMATDMPDSEEGVWEWFDNATTVDRRTRIHAMIEQVHSMPQQGVASSFTFGMGYGGLRMACVACGIRLQSVTPQAWHKVFDVPARPKVKGEKGLKGRRKEGAYTKWKLQIRDIAKQLFPKLYVWGCSQTFQLSVCDALLIAEFSRRLDTNQTTD